MALIVLATVVDGMDASIVNVVLPDISRELGMSVSSSAFVSVAYLIPIAGLCLAFSKLAERADIRRMFLVGTAVFSLASLGCSVSSSDAMLVLMRFVQGIGATFMVATTPIMVVRLLPEDHRGRGMGAIAAGSGISVIIGPTVGGLIGDVLSWHWVFFINVPVGIVAAVIAHKAIPADTGFDRSAFDYKGSALLFLSLVTGLYALESFPSHGVTTMTVVSLVLFVILFSLFVAYERRLTLPVLNLRVFRSGRFVAVSVSFLVMNACYMGCLYLLPYFMRVELGFDTIMCGLFLLVAALMTLIFCLKVGKMADMRGNRPFVIAGCLLMVVAMAVFSIMDASMPTWVLIVGLALLGTMWGVAGGPIGSRLIDNVPRDQRGSGSALLSFFIYFGSALGTALFAGLFGFGSAAAGQPIADLDPAVFMDGFGFAMTFGVAIAAIALILSWVVNEEKRSE